jgi:hypothetical protein
VNQKISSGEILSNPAIVSHKIKNCPSEGIIIQTHPPAGKSKRIFFIEL